MCTGIKVSITLYYLFHNKTGMINALLVLKFIMYVVYRVLYLKLLLIKITVLSFKLHITCYVL